MKNDKVKNTGNFGLLQSKILSKPDKQHKEKKEDHMQFKSFVQSLRGPGAYAVHEKETDFNVSRVPE